MNWILKKSLNHGTRNPIVARMFLQNSDLIGFFQFTKEKKDEVLGLVHDAQEQLLHCFDILAELEEKEKEIIDSIVRDGVPTQAGGRVAEPPTIDKIEQSAHTFLYSAKSSLRLIKSFVCEFFVEGKKKRKKLEDGNFRTLAEWADERFGPDSDFARFLSEHHSHWIDEIYSKRNAVEHPGGSSGHIHISNFSAAKNPETKEWTGTRPTWSRNEDPPSILTEDMREMIGCILMFSEDLFVLCLRNSTSIGPVEFYEIPEKDRNPEWPTRIKIGLKK